MKLLDFGLFSSLEQILPGKPSCPVKGISQARICIKNCLHMKALRLVVFTAAPWPPDYLPAKRSPAAGRLTDILYMSFAILKGNRTHFKQVI